MINSVKIIFIIFLSAINLLIAENNIEVCKIRLPESVNSYQPVLVPVINLWGTILYFDRQEHPDNTGNYRDKDEIWYSRKKEDNWSESARFDNPVNSPGNDVIFSLLPDGKTAFGYGSFKPEHKHYGYALLKRKQNIWTLEKYLEISGYENKSPLFSACMSYDGKVLILSAENENSTGKHDLFISFLNETDGLWSKPKNLGKNINTVFTESSPFLAWDNRTLYFASDGINKNVKTDLYMTKRLDDTWLNWSDPINLGKQINTGMDDKSIYLTAASDSAYIVSYDTVSKRSGIYKICLPERLQPDDYYIFTGTVYKENGGDLQPFYEKCRITFKNGNDSDFTFSDENTGGYIAVAQVRNPKISLSHPGHKCYSEFSGKKFPHGMFIEKNFIIKDCPVEPVELSETRIYFEKDSYILDNNDINELKKIIAGTGKIILIAHADSTGTYEYNLTLSERRAESVKNHLIKIGINKNLIEVKAVGETEPLSDKNSENRCVEISYFRKRL